MDNVSCFFPICLARRLRSGGEQLVFISARYVIWQLGLASTAVENFPVDWAAVNGKYVVEEVAEEVELSSTPMPEIDHFVMLLRNDADWTQHFGSIDSRLI